MTRKIGSFVASSDMRIATLPIGYADGIPWGIERVFIFGTPCRTVGGICMDQMMVDVSGVKVSMGDEVTVFGKADGQSAEALSRDSGVLVYSILTGISRRVPRIFIKGGREIERVNYLDTL